MRIREGREKSKKGGGATKSFLLIIKTEFMIVPKYNFSLRY